MSIYYGEPVRDPKNLSLPLYGATLGESLSRFFRKYFTYSGRASRSEFWWVQLVFWGVIVAAGGVFFAAGTVGSSDSDLASDGAGSGVLLAVLGLVFILVFFVFGIGNIALTVRRLHDINASGWWYLLMVVGNILAPIGTLGYVIVGVLPSKPEGRRFDPGYVPVAGAPQFS